MSSWERLCWGWSVSPPAAVSQYFGGREKERWSCGSCWLEKIINRHWWRKLETSHVMPLLYDVWCKRIFWIFVEDTWPSIHPLMVNLFVLSSFPLRLFITCVSYCWIYLVFVLYIFNSQMKIISDNPLWELLAAMYNAIIIAICPVFNQRLEESSNPTKKRSLLEEDFYFHTSKKQHPRKDKGASHTTVGVMWSILSWRTWKMYKQDACAWYPE